MENEPEPTNGFAQVVDAVFSGLNGITPNAVKALDRLIGRSVDVPVAWLEQQKAKIDAQTASFKLVEASVAAAVASGVGSDPEIIQNAMNGLVRKAYRKQANRKGVVVAMVEDLQERALSDPPNNELPPVEDIDEDWLNVFERYAEDASSERLQRLWGRILSGEVRKPGNFSTRALRYISELSHAEALIFEDFAHHVFGPAAPKKLVIRPENTDIRPLMQLEASGLIQGASGLGQRRLVTFNKQGFGFIVEEEYCIVFRGEPDTTIKQEVISLTAVGQELLTLIENRQPQECAKAVAFSLRVPEIYDCYLGVRAAPASSQSFNLSEVLWQKDSAQSPTVEGEIKSTIDD